MDITLKIEKILPTYNFVSKKDGKPNTKYSFVGRTDGEYPKTVCMTVWGDDLWARLGIIVGNSYNLSFDIDSREYQDRYYTEVKCYKAVLLSGSQQAAAPTTQPATPNTTANNIAPQGAKEPPF